MGLKEIFENIQSKKSRLRELEIEDAAQHKLHERKKSSNEREYEKILESKRQEEIKKYLEDYRKKERKDYWEADTISQKNIFVGQKNLNKQPGIMFGRYK